jgi:hypothetical protein
MKRLIAASLLTALMLSAGGFLTLSRAQSPSADLKPTFISPTPGLYVNGWPAFTVTYPREWVVLREVPGEVFRVGGTGPDLPQGVSMPVLGVGVMPTRLPLEDWARVFMPGLQWYFTDIKVLSDKPSQLKDGTPAREVEVEVLPKYDPTLGKLTDAPKLINYKLLTKRNGTWIWVTITEDKARFGEDLKKHAYSLTFVPGKEEPVNVPPDVREFLQMQCADMVSRDVESIMAHYSDRFLHSGLQKAFYERMIRTNPIPEGTAQATVTVFEPRGDTAYIDGFFFRTAKDGTSVKAPMLFQQIIKEQGRWKWFGNQK